MILWPTQLSAFGIGTHRDFRRKRMQPRVEKVKKITTPWNLAILTATRFKPAVL
jgi:hypothetical protein